MSSVLIVMVMSMIWFSDVSSRLVKKLIWILFRFSNLFQMFTSAVEWPRRRCHIFRLDSNLSCICFNAALIIPHHYVNRMKSFQPKHKQELFAAIFWRWVFMRQDNQCRSKYSWWDKVSVIIVPHFSRSPEMCVLSRLTSMSSY